MLGLGLNFGSSESGSSAARMGGPALLLDTYSGAAAAYSLRKLNSSYSGKVLQVRRAFDHVEVDVGFDSNGLLSLDSPVTNVVEESTGITQGSSTNAAKLGEFCGEARRSGGDTSYASVDSMTEASHVEIVTWYDQSGNANNATQAAAASQPRIYDRTTGVVTENGKPAVDFLNGTYTVLKTSANITNSDTISFYSVLQMAAAAWQAISGISTGSSVRNEFKISSNRKYNIIGTGSQLNGSQITIGQQTLAYAKLDSSSGELAINGNTAITGTGTSVQPLTNAPIAIGGRAHTGGESFTGTLQEVIYWFSTPPTRTDIEDNINTFYSIY